MVLAYNYKVMMYFEVTALRLLVDYYVIGDANEVQ